MTHGGRSKDNNWEENDTAAPVSELLEASDG
jgi:hypothetical protein